MRRGQDPVRVNPQVQGLWLDAHVVTALAGYALFTLACVLAVFYLVQDRNLKRKKFGRLFRGLPALETLDRLIGGQILHAFGAFSISIGLGIILAHVNHWRAAWLTDPKTMATGVTWLLYAILSYLRLSAGQHGRKVAIITILGFGLVLISFFGVNYFSAGMHRFALAGTPGGGG
jgi:ABC-type transport system involved in cytochrome c biogenesis permease subunit